MKEWLGEKLIGVGMIILVVTMATMVNNGSAPADPFLLVVVLLEKLATNLALGVVVGAGLLVTWLGWLVPVGIALFLIAHLEPERLTVAVTHDEDGLPTVTWREPRYENWRWLLKAYTVEGRCWLRATPDRWMFCYQVTAPWWRGESSHYCEVLFRSVVGFSVTDADTLYGTGGPRSDELYSQRLVVRADLYPAQNGVALLPLTLTCAPRSEVEGLHQALANAFSSAMLDPAFDLIIARYSQYVPGRSHPSHGVPPSIA